LVIHFRFTIAFISSLLFMGLSVAAEDSSGLCQKNLKQRIDDDWRQESGSVKLPPFSERSGSVELEIVT
jgi:hypothetical protein